MRIAILPLMLIGLAGPPAAASPESELQAMLAEAKAIPEAVVTEAPDFIMVADEANLVFHYFTKPNHPAHPAAIYRAVLRAPDGAWYIGYRVRHFGPDKTPPQPVLDWLAEFQAMDEEMREELERDHSSSGK